MQRRHVRGQGSVFKRGKWYHVCYSIDSQTFRESAHTQIEDEAKAYLAKIIGSKYAGAPISASSVRVRDLLKLVEQQYELEERASLYIAKLKINRYLLPAFGNLKATELTTSRIKSYIAKRKQQDARPATINREIALVRRGFKLGYDHDPPLIARVPKFPELDESDNVRTGFLRPEQYKVLLAELPKDLKLIDGQLAMHLRSFSPAQFAAYLGRMIDAGITCNGQGERFFQDEARVLRSK